MANTTTTPNMLLPVPVPGTDPGPDWANNIVADMYGIDGHDHTTGKGVPLTPAGLNINSDLPLNGNNLTTTRSVRFSPQSVALPNAADIGTIYELGVDLYYKDGAGNNVRITQGGSVTGSAGTITGLPSGTASASFAAGTFTFQSATNTPATMAVGPLVIGRVAASSKTVTVAPNSGQSANYSLTFPAAAPDTNQSLVSDNVGNLSWVYAQIGQLPIGSVVGTFPNLTGAYSCSATTVADAAGFVKCNGQTISDVTSPMNGQVVPNINDSIFVSGSTTSGSSGGADSVTLSTANLATHTHGAGNYATSVGVTGGTASLTGTTTFGSAGHGHTFPHVHQWTHTDTTSASPAFFALPTPGSGVTTIDSLNTQIFSGVATGAAAGVNRMFGQNTAADYYTTGVLSAPSGSGSTALTNGPNASASVGLSNTAASMTGSNDVGGSSSIAGGDTAFSIIPRYITALYVMRIK